VLEEGAFAATTPWRGSSCGFQHRAVDTVKKWLSEWRRLANAAMMCADWGKAVRTLELADIALAAVTIILMSALLLGSMPGWH